METPIYKLFEIIPENIIDGLDGIKATTKEWAGYEYTVKSSYGNIELIAENIYSFVEHNYLPVEGRSLDGHYEIFVNTKTFCFLIRQYGYYGGLTYITPPKESGWKELNEADLYYIKAIVASKLKGMYFYDYNAIHGRGRNLFSTGKKAKPAGLYNEEIVQWDDGPKISLIVDYKRYRDESGNDPEKLGHLNEIDFEAIKLLACPVY
jgi:hypothetical protein